MLAFYFVGTAAAPRMPAEQQMLLAGETKTSRCRLTSKAEGGGGVWGGS